MSKATKIYESFNHAKTSVRYHLIFSTKFRRKCLDKIRDTVLNSFREVEKVSDFKILVMELDKDHIHLLMKWKPHLSIEQVVRRLKQMSSKLIWNKEETYLRQFYWKDRELWTGGYFCSTIGEVSEETIKRYIENQG